MKTKTKAKTRVKLCRVNRSIALLSSPTCLSSSTVASQLFVIIASSKLIAPSWLRSKSFPSQRVQLFVRKVRRRLPRWRLPQIFSFSHVWEAGTPHHLYHLLNHNIRGTSPKGCKSGFALTCIQFVGISIFCSNSHDPFHSCTVGLFQTFFLLFVIHIFSVLWLPSLGACSLN